MGLHKWNTVWRYNGTVSKGDRNKQIRLAINRIELECLLFRWLGRLLVEQKWSRVQFDIFHLPIETPTIELLESMWDSKVFKQSWSETSFYAIHKSLKTMLAEKIEWKWEQQEMFKNDLIISSEKLKLRIHYGHKYALRSRT